MNESQCIHIYIYIYAKIARSHSLHFSPIEFNHPSLRSKNVGLISIAPAMSGGEFKDQKISR